jgi:cyclophilin family peptidyl-prolyl cis-trans isomerase
MRFLAVPLLLLWPALAAAEEKPAAEAGDPIVLIETNWGNIRVELFEDKAPITVKNFLAYVEKSHYDSTLFHRVIPNFLIQGGGYGVDLRPKETGPPIKSEARNGLRNKRGTVAMARKKRDADTATCQFYINVVDNAMLDRDNADDGTGYTVFGRVIDGMAVVDRIRKVPTSRGPLARVHPTQPTKPVIIKTVRVVK